MTDREETLILHCTILHDKKNNKKTYFKKKSTQSELPKRLKPLQQTPKTTIDTAPISQQTNPHITNIPLTTTTAKMVFNKT